MLISRTYVFLMVFAVSFLACKDNSEKTNEQSKSPEIAVLDMTELQKEGHIRALVDNSSTSYFVYKGEPMGFEYELLSRFAKHVNLELEVIPIDDLDFVIDSLNDLKGDIIAANLTVTKDRANDIAFTDPILFSNQVLVQRSDKDVIKSPSQLIGEEVYLRKNSSFYERVKNLSEEIGGNIYIKEVAGNVTVEELIKQVSEGKIDFTIADKHVAKINKAFYQNIDVSTQISLEQQFAWAIRKTSPDLLNAVNNWLEKFKKTVDFRVIYLKYFGNTQLYRSRVNSNLFTRKSGKISPYDELVKKESQKIKWDWRLVSSLIYQESQFDHNAKSWVGAFGLMQLMPETAASYGVDSTSSAQANLAAGVQYLEWLDKQFEDKVRDSSERVKFVLAAYNVGLGHVFDAIRLADKYDLNPEVWKHSVGLMLKNKSKPKYYQDTAAYYGYCRGSEPYAYVSQIMNRFEHYKNMTESEELALQEN